MNVPSPTHEQLEALAKFETGRPLKVTAFAGAGKTTTLRLLAGSRSSRGLYLAFNRSIADEAGEKFPRTVDCRTTHSLAFRSVQAAHRFSSGKMTGSLYAKQLADALGLRGRVFGGKLRLTGVHQAHLLLRTLRNFSQSADHTVSTGHVPQYGRLLGIPPSMLHEVQAWAASECSTLWSRMTDHRDAIPLGHDGYLKLWALGKPKLGYQYILLDEAQDTNPVVLEVLADQSAQIVYVGDRHQQIYEWRGAINAMEKIEGCEEAYLTQSFRFGSAIAGAASDVLRTLGETKALRGNNTVSSTIGSNGHINVVLARTNATVILEVLQAVGQGLRPHVVGGVDELKRLLNDVYELKKGKPAASAEFFGFQNWTEVVHFAKTEEGESIRAFVLLVEQHGEDKLWAAVSGANADEEGADLSISTAHKAKGREWDAVRLAGDFASSRLNGVDPAAEAEVRLFYVAMTRAQRHLSVAPELLATFTSGSWRNRKPQAPGAFEAPPSTSRPRAEPLRPEPDKVREARGSTIPPPIDITPRSSTPTPRPTTPVPKQVHEIVPDNVRQQHPGTAYAPEVPVVSAVPQKAEAPLQHPDFREVVPERVRQLHPAARLGQSGGPLQSARPNIDNKPERTKPWWRFWR